MPGPTTHSQSVSGFDPRSVPGCQLWLDAIDTSSVTGSSTVTAWRDKSSNATNASNSGSPALTSSAINGKQAIYLNGSSQLSGSSTGSGTTLTVCIVGTQSSGTAASGGLVCLGRSGYPDWNDIGSLAIAQYGSGGMISTRTTNSQGVTTGTSSPFIYILIFDGTYVNTYYNGTIQSTANISVSGTFAYTNYVIGNRAGNTGNYYWTGYIGEVIIYNISLSKIDRQSIEGYLAKKWGSITLPTTHPFYYYIPYSRPFTPVDIPGCSIWLDGADRKTMLQSGGAPVSASGQSIVTWVDKAQNFSFTTGGQYSNWNTYTPLAPTYGSSDGVFFNNTSSGLSSSEYGLGIYSSPTPLFYAPTQSMTLITVTLPTYNNSYRRIALTGTYPLSGGPPNFILGPQMGSSEGGSILFDLNSGGSAWGQTIYTNTGYNSNITTRIDTMISAPGATEWWWTNGTLNTFQYSNAYTSSYSNFPVNYFFLGAYTGNIDGGRCFAGTIYEVLFYTTALTRIQRQQVEGYLAWKWGFSSSITSNPYTKFPPSSTLPFSPTNITGCVMWLDGADQTNMTLSGLTISQWNDKSGNGYNVTQGTSSQYPTLAISKNGNTMVTFTQSSSTFLSNGSFGNLITTGVATYFVVEYNMTAPSGNPGPIGWSGSQANNNYGVVWQYNPGFVGGGNATNSGLQPYYTTTKYDVPFYSANPRIDYLYIPNSGGTGVIGYINGVASANTDSANYNGASYASYTFWVGRGPSGYLSGNICEILVFNVSLTTSQRQQVEGYLSWKWTIPLPTTHPYSKIVPAQAYTA